MAGEIVKKSNGEILPHDEPLFLIRARDRLALPLLREYRRMCQGDGCNEYIVGLLDEMITQFDEFQKEHPERMKQPGVTRGR